MSAYLRAKWSLGAVQSRYVFEGEGGDQFCGRTATGLPIHSVEFAVLPPHFCSYVVSNEQLALLHTGYSRMPVSFKQTIPFLLASLVYHKEWLEANLNPSHPLFTTYLWTSGAVSSFKNYVRTGNYQCNDTGMKATGIPPQISILYELFKVHSNLDAVQQTVANKSKELMDAIKGKP